VLAVQLVQMAYKLVKLDKQKLKETTKLLYRTLDVSALKQAFSNHRILSTYIHQRNDYIELLDAYFAGVDNWTRVHLPGMDYQRKVSPKNILTAFNYVFLRRHNGSYRQRYYIACYFVHYLNIHDSLRAAFKGTDLRGKKYIPFNSAFDLETLLTQFFAKKGAETYHISHGLSYVKYNNLISFDSINGENITAENVLVWGETSKSDLVINHDRDVAAITVAGNPKYPFKRINVGNAFKKGIIFLGAAIYDMKNAALLKLASRLAANNDIKFEAKAHPNSDMALLAEAAASANIQLLPKDRTILETLRSGNYDFAIAYNTTAYYEAMYYNMVCFRYMVDENGEFSGLNDKFYDERSFANQLIYFKEKDIHTLNKDIEHVLEANLGMGINKYQTIFNN
jgi:hypothetical protein